MLVLEELIVYPLKSGKGIRLSEANMTETGLEYDREWMVVRRTGTETLEMLTAREFPSMVLIEATVEKLENGTVILILNAPEMTELRVPRTYAVSPVKVEIWDSPAYGANQGQEAATWLNKYLCIDNSSLLAKNPSFVRDLPTKHLPAPELFQLVPQASFSDGFPFLLLSSASIRAFKSQQPGVSAMNFRPNLIVGGGEAYQEDSWLKIRIGKEHFVINSLCHRCVLTNVNPNTGISDQNTLKEMMKTRRIDRGGKYEPCMGVNATHTRVGGKIAIGDIVKVLQTGVHDGRGIWDLDVFPKIYTYESDALL